MSWASFVSDGSLSHHAAVERQLFNATHVIDRFHFVRWFAQGLIEVKRRVQRIGEPGESPVFSPVIFKTRYLQLARAGHLDDKQFSRLSLALAEEARWRFGRARY